MASLELHERFFGNGLVGSIRPDSDLQSLESTFASSFDRISGQLNSLGSDLSELGWSLETLSAGLNSMNRELEVQTSYLAAQLSTLQSIDAALRTPAKTRAAERMADAAGLLRTGRFELALKCADEAIDGDPNHPGGFAAAGYALVGLGRTRDAYDKFREADIAAKPSEQLEGTYARMCARCLIVEGETTTARATLEWALGRMADHPAYAASRARTNYDLAIVCALADDDNAASDHLVAAVRTADVYAQLALVEPTFDGKDHIVAPAVEIAAEIARARADRDRADRDRRALASQLETLRRRRRDVKNTLDAERRRCNLDDELAGLLHEVAVTLANTLDTLLAKELTLEGAQNVSALLDEVETQVVELKRAEQRVFAEREQIFADAIARYQAEGWEVAYRGPDRATLRRRGRFGSKTEHVLRVNAHREITTTPK